MPKKLPDVGPLEMKVLGVVASGHDLSVSHIQQTLKKGGKNLAYTTVMTVLVRLYNKGLVERKKKGRQYFYAVGRKKSFSSVKILERVKKSLFGSDHLQPILGLLDANEDLSRVELEELRKAIDEKIKQKEGKR